jgi:TonB family protein
MSRPSSSFVLPACLSLTVHAWLLIAVPRYFSVGNSSDRGNDNPPPHPAPEVLPAPPEQLPETEIGDRAGKGYATHQVDAEHAATAREAEVDQAYLGLNPPGIDKTGAGKGLAELVSEDASSGAARGGATRRPPARSVSPFGVSAELKLPQPTKASPPQPPTAVADAGGVIFGQSSVPVDRVEDAAPLPPLSTPATQPTPMPTQEVALAPQPTPMPSPESTASGGSVRGEPLPTGSPARMSDSESDPFSRLGSATFRDGRLDIQFGRKVKTRKPKILLAGTLDLMTLRRASVVLKIDVDETGKVTTVTVDKSSGSNDIDQPTRVAVYDWWFEPPVDAAGRPLADHLKFTINWR